VPNRTIAAAKTVLSNKNVKTIYGKVLRFFFDNEVLRFVKAVAELRDESYFYLLFAWWS
jgi:hypothetical protein